MKIYINKRCSDISQAKKFLIELNFGTDKNYCLEYSDNKKPNLVCDGKQAGFISISHSDGTLAMAFSDKPVGIDIERKDRKISVCQNIEEWTKIEAYCKYTGEGLSKKAVSMKKKKAITGVVGIGESAKKTDWYKIVLKKSARITLECDVVSSSNIYIEVIPSKKITSIRGKHTIALGNERGERGKVTFQTTTGKKLPTGTYYIKVHRNSRNASTNGIYRIKWTK